MSRRLTARSLECRQPSAVTDAELRCRADRAAAEGLDQGVLVLRRDHPALTEEARWMWDALATVLRKAAVTSSGANRDRVRDPKTNFRDRGVTASRPGHAATAEIRTDPDQSHAEVTAPVTPAGKGRTA